MGMSFTVTHYRNHHKVIKAIKKLSFLATCDPEITSTSELLAGTSDETCDTSSVVTIKASHDSGYNPIEERTHSKKIPFFSAKSRTNAGFLPSDPPNQGGKTPSIPTMDHDISLDLTDQCGDIPYDLTTTSRGMPAYPTYDGMTSRPAVQSPWRVLLEIWGWKASLPFVNKLIGQFR